jgi:hypothetical protein
MVVISKVVRTFVGQTKTEVMETTNEQRLYYRLLMATLNSNRLPIHVMKDAQDILSEVICGSYPATYKKYFAGVWQEKVDKYRDSFLQNARTVDLMMSNSNLSQ